MIRLIAFSAILLFLPGCLIGASSSQFNTSSATTTTNGAGSSGSKVQISWAAGGGAQTGYNIEQSTDSMNYTIVQTASATATSATVSGLNRSSTYYFRIQSYNSAGASGFSTVVKAVIP